MERPAPAIAGDMDVLASLLAGDEDAFARLVDAWHGPLARLALHYVDGPALADEVVQDTWIAFLGGLNRFEGRSSLKTWLFRILINTARARRRAESRSIPFSAAFRDRDEGAVEPGSFVPRWVPRVGGHWMTAPAPWRDEPENAALAAETARLVAAAIAALPPAQREVITLRDVEGFSAGEVCNTLGVSDTNQRVLLHRARTRVRKALAPHLEAGR